VATSDSNQCVISALALICQVSAAKIIIGTTKLSKSLSLETALQPLQPSTLDCLDELDNSEST